MPLSYSDDSSSESSDPSPDSSDPSPNVSPNVECMTCREEATAPFETECGHTFHYLCLKAHIATNSYTCPACREPISRKLYEDACIEGWDIPLVSWLYSGRNGGWWCYDPDINKQIEEEYQKYIAGSDESREGEDDAAAPAPSVISVWMMSRQYSINFKEMTQKPFDFYGQKRDIKREINTGSTDEVIKGIAGVKIL